MFSEFNAEDSLHNRYHIIKQSANNQPWCAEGVAIALHISETF